MVNFIFGLILGVGAGSLVTAVILLERWRK